MAGLFAAAGAMLGLGHRMLPSYRFMVVLDGIPVALFTEVVLPSLTVETDEFFEGGQNAYKHTLPKQVDAGTITLKRGVTSMMEFTMWYDHILEGDIANAKKDVAIIFFNLRHLPTIAWNFRDAYPIKWTGPTLTSDSQSLAIEELELTHHGFEYINF
ncbi:MAG: phage tail protein [Chloroflexota bacterium]